MKVAVKEYMMYSEEKQDVEQFEQDVNTTKCDINSSHFIDTSVVVLSSDYEDVHELAERLDVNIRTVQRFIQASGIKADLVRKNMRGRDTYYYNVQNVCTLWQNKSYNVTNEQDAKSKPDVVVSGFEDFEAVNKMSDIDEQDVEQFEQNAQQNAQNLMTIAELAQSENVSTKTLRNWLAECEIDPTGFKKNLTGSDSPIYDVQSVKLKFQAFKDFRLANKMSDQGKLKFMIGHVELEGTSQQRDALRNYVDELYGHIEHQDKKILYLEENNARLAQERLDVEQIAVNNANAARDLMCYIPDDKLTQEQLDHKYAPTFDEILAAHHIIPRRH
jgi:ribonucleotide monophosphatase NagD (HAD superfamily)